ncbi:HK97-gp10 family putative phage morphogenesis protein [Tissierella sp. Yu-01]|uniref:HK97-gp10 family putative phage morphogenesis protein n=1 Tax=Tissierella sp. Yu-01 TaxID=3035694 RepID=UPI00240E1A2E|nr:HK97-gp10 family putative phage morphogenesis protein [Tissierella sp. Yu-01]WFA10334.1 HK97 gp10 family phage protein [Tissierella sp. Yu-01]
MSLEGFDILIKKLDRIGKDSPKAVAKAVKEATKKVQGDAKDLAPVDKGQLRNSIQGTVQEKDGEIVGIVSTNLEYAPYVEFGTGQRGEGSPSPPKYGGDLSYREDWSGMAAQPYMYPALRQNEEYIKETIAASIKMEIQKKGD